MSTFTTAASRNATAKGKDKVSALAPGLVLVVICLSSLVLVFVSEPFARAVELIGQY